METQDGRLFTTDKLVITAGARASEICKVKELKIRPSREVIFLFDTLSDATVNLNQLTCRGVILAQEIGSYMEEFPRLEKDYLPGVNGFKALDGDAGVFNSFFLT